jgi:hypothetical protein
VADPVTHLRGILEQEVALHRELVHLARARHLLVCQHRFAEAAEVAVAEAACIVAVRELERRRSRLAGGAAHTPEVARLRREIASLVRRLAAVERAAPAVWLVPPTVLLAGSGARMAQAN